MGGDVTTRTNQGEAMQQPFTAQNNVDSLGRPAGGYVHGTSLDITWQDGPLSVDGERREPNGAFVETVIAAALQRIEHYNETQFKCRENSLAITKLEEALHWLNARTARRTAEGTEGTHQGN